MTEGQRILHLRKLIKKNQQEFAQLISVSQAALSDIENGKNGISYPVFKKLVEEIGVHPYWFMWGQEPIFREKEFAEKYNIPYNPASPTESANASPAHKTATSNDSKLTMEEVMKALSDLQGEVNKIKRKAKKHEK
ncbi:helix-turn-helix protein [Chitinophaga dinghuensis]|uniref:Helix-turn-helix protein n=1 Tax=Chitinophaga dinghuensis TaxID=1539050 RepID=A0A327VLA0_9BACT|nr:helix-turn-helix transcriptional regulator [Chitinophaga dinghuensis]RAJ75520.1 helix-turn-helix protein [Chitinophaga dinghuensis]